MSPRIEHASGDDTVDRRYFWAKITTLYSVDDTADISVVDDKEVILSPERTFLKCPIFYHCEPNAVKRSNGALTGSASAFTVNDIVYCHYHHEGPVPTIVARKDLKSCGEGFCLIFEPDLIGAFTKSFQVNPITQEQGDMITWKAQADTHSRKGFWNIIFLTPLAPGQPATTFSYYGIDDNYNVLGSGTGDIYHNLTISNRFTIPYTCWVGPFLEGDRLDFETYNGVTTFWNYDCEDAKCTELIYNPMTNKLEEVAWDYIYYKNASTFLDLWHYPYDSWGPTCLQYAFSRNELRMHFISGIDYHEPELTWICANAPNADSPPKPTVAIGNFNNVTRVPLFRERVCLNFSHMSYSMSGSTGIMTVDRSDPNYPLFHFKLAEYNGQIYLTKERVWRYNKLYRTATLVTSNYENPINQSAFYASATALFNHAYGGSSEGSGNYETVLFGCQSVLDVFNYEWVNQMTTCIGESISIVIPTNECAPKYGSSSYNSSFSCVIPFAEFSYSVDWSGHVEVGIGVSVFIFASWSGGGTCCCVDGVYQARDYIGAQATYAGAYTDSYLEAQYWLIDIRWFPLPAWKAAGSGMSEEYHYTWTPDPDTYGDYYGTEYGIYPNGEWWSDLATCANCVPYDDNYTDFRCFGDCPGCLDAIAHTSTSPPACPHGGWDYLNHGFIDRPPTVVVDFGSWGDDNITSKGTTFPSTVNKNSIISLAVGAQYAMCSVRNATVTFYKKELPDGSWEDITTTITDAFNGLPHVWGFDSQRYQGLVYAGTPNL